MNARKSLTFLTVFALISLSALGALFTDGFEDGDMANYYVTEGVNSYGAATDQVYEGTYSGRVLNNGDFSTVRKDLGSTYKPDNVKVAMRVQGEASNMHGFFRLVDGTNDKTQLEIWTDDGTSLGATSGSEISIDGNVIRSSSSGNTWYYIELLGIDWNSGKISEIKVDGTQEVTDVSLTASNISSIELHTNQAGSGDYVWWDSIEFSDSNAQPSIESVEFSPSTWRGQDSIDVEANVSDSDGLSDISNVTVSVYEGNSKIVDSKFISETATQGIYSGNDIFTVDTGDVFYNVSVKVNDSSGAKNILWENRSVTNTSLSWTDNSANEEGFRISTNITGSFTQVGDVSSDSTSFNFLTSQLNFGDTRCFRVESYNQYGESSPAEGCLVP